MKSYAAKLKKLVHMEFLQGFYAIKKLYEKYLTKPILFLILCLLILMLYLWPFIPTHRRYRANVCVTCLPNYNSNEYNLDKIYEINSHFKKLAHILFTGNGYIGMFSTMFEKNLFIKYDLLSLPIDINPILNIRYPGLLVQEAHLSSFKNGYVQHMRCINIKGQCHYIEETFIAHRQINSLLIQKYIIKNPSENDVAWEAYIDKKTYNKEDEIDISKYVQNAQLLSQKFEVSYGVADGIKIKKGNYYHTPFLKRFSLPDIYLYAKYIQIRPKNLIVATHSEAEFRVYTFFRYSLQLQPVNNSSQNIFDNIDELLKLDISASINGNLNTIIDNHVQAWHDLWTSGFAISFSKSTSALNGDHINATFYYYLCNQPFYSVGSQNTDKVVSSPSPNFVETAKSLHVRDENKDNCYNSHSTLLSSTLWNIPHTKEELISKVMLWDLTLDKNGCYRKIQNQGATGALQALIFSVGAFKQTANHLEFSMDPKDLHRDMTFRNIAYKNLSLITIDVTIGEDNRASLSISIELNDKPTTLYACDAGCLEPLQLPTNEPATFPVKLTNPLTSLLYISEDKSHLEYLKHTLHVQDIMIAPAHETHVIAIHKHGHSFGGLPTLFWVSIACLIVLFHLFLFKLIYSEYFGNGSNYHHRDKYFA